MLAHVNAVLLMWHYIGASLLLNAPGITGTGTTETDQIIPSGRWRHEFIEERHRQGKRHPEKDD